MQSLLTGTFLASLMKRDERYFRSAMGKSVCRVCQKLWYFDVFRVHVCHGLNLRLRANIAPTFELLAGKSVLRMGRVELQTQFEIELILRSDSGSWALKGLGHLKEGCKDAPWNLAPVTLARWLESPLLIGLWFKPQQQWICFYVIGRAFFITAGGWGRWKHWKSKNASDPWNQQVWFEGCSCWWMLSGVLSSEESWLKATCCARCPTSKASAGVG